MTQEQSESLSSKPPVKLVASYEYTVMMLGRNFIAPSEVERKFGFVYSGSQILDLYSTLMATDIIAHLVAAGCVLMPSPPADMDIHEIMHLDSPASEGVPVEWSGEVKLVGRGWLAIRQGGFGIAGKVSSIPTERMLTVSETIYGATVCQALRGINLIGHDHVMTATVLKSGCRAHVAFPAAKSFHITGIWENDRYDYLSGLTF